MIDKNTRNKNLMKKIINIITAWIAIIIAQIIADKFFDESFVWTLIIMTQTSHPKSGHKACINAGWDTNQLIS